MTRFGRENIAKENGKERHLKRMNRVDARRPGTLSSVPRQLRISSFKH